MNDDSLSMSQIAEDGEHDYYEWMREHKPDSFAAAIAARRAADKARAAAETEALSERILAGELTFAEAAAALLRGEKS